MVATACLIVTEVPMLQQAVLWSHVNGEGSYSLTMSLLSRVRWCWVLKMDSACTISQYNDLFWGNVSAPKLPTGWPRQEGSGAAWPHPRDMRTRAPHAVSTAPLPCATTSGATITSPTPSLKLPVAAATGTSSTTTSRRQRLPEPMNLLPV